MTVESLFMVIVIMGVTGAGKTTVGRLLGAQLGWPFVDADDYHPAANIEKISKGISLTDDDRRPWLHLLRGLISNWIARGENGILACSALKRHYQDELNASPQVKFVLLEGAPALIAERLNRRRDHFAGAEILTSQFADLELPEQALCLQITQPPQEIVADIRKSLGL